MASQTRYQMESLPTTRRHADVEIADNDRDDGHGAENNPQIDTVLKSSRRDIADEDVADDTAADSRRRTEDEDAEEVHAP